MNCYSCVIHIAKGAPLQSYKTMIEIWNITPALMNSSDHPK
jgi:hypothetical protein